MFNICSNFFSQPNLRKPHHISLLRQESQNIFNIFDVLKSRLKAPAERTQLLYLLYQYCLIINTDGHSINHLYLEFMQLAIETKSYDLALPVAEHSVFQADVVTVKNVQSTLTNIQAQQYFYYAGLVCAACKKFTSAVKLFNIGLSIPVSKANIVQEAIWQKYMICYMLAYRTSAPPPLFLVEPQYLAMATQNELIQTISDYFSRPEASPEEMAEKIEVNRVRLKAITCYGLAKQLIGVLRERQLIRQTQIFDSVSIASPPPQLMAKGQQLILRLLRLFRVSSVDMRIDMDGGSVFFVNEKDISNALTRETQLAKKIQEQMLLLSELSTQLEKTKSDTKQNSYLLQRIVNASEERD
ncbi:hypothetical protein BLNAU_6275 [Blattamonas nauphoetae]|uniref:COP9 signalosome complex subunit 3 N-terminal helical repeats domain-containing protein n=1 Tax=Blattamonas nauphoetae TaxID=2049346 RepID=A0ABQ9Y4V0_9EUKA|nr:hypothetical protein BLNAU_6275 [Blattamonas nauphoetae]